MNQHLNTLKAEKAFLTKKHTCEETSALIQPIYYSNIRIPTYQRPYSWKKEQIHQLLKDLWECESYMEYFLGNVILINDKLDTNKCDVVDGQQRLTSLLLMHIWFRNYFNQKGIIEFSSNINLINDCEFEMSFDDNEILKEIRTNKKNENYVNVFKNLSKKKNSEFKKRQIKTFKVVMNEIHKFFNSKQKLELINFFKFLSNNVFCLRIIDNPNGSVGDMLFCSLNGKGLPLDQTDIIKSFFIRDFMKTNGEMAIFKKMWSDLLVSTEDNLKREFSTFFAWKNVKLKGRKWTTNVENFLDKNKNEFSRKQLFADLHAWCEGSQQVKSMNSGEPTIDFFNKINAFFRFEKSKEIVYFFSNVNVKENGKCKKEFIRFLELVFKLNFFIVYYEKERIKEFTEKIVDEVRKMVIKSSYAQKEEYPKLFKSINNWLETKLKEYIASKKIFENFSPLNYSYSNATEKKMIKLLLLLERCYDENTNTFDYAQGCDAIDHNLDHILAKKMSDDQKEFIYKTSRKDDKYIVEFNCEVFGEIMETHGLKQGMEFKEFCNKTLNKHINLHFASAFWNKTKSNKPITVTSAKTIFSNENIRKKNEYLKDLFYLFVYEKPRQNKVSKLTGIKELWKETEDELKRILKFVYDPTKGKSFNVQLLDDAFENEILETHEDLNSLHALRIKRNNIVHEKKNEFLNDKEYERIVEIIENLKTF